MIEVKEVLTRRQKKEFIDFPNRLYKGNPYYVAPLYLDEIKIFNKDYVYLDTCEAVYYLAYKDGAVAGRISGILQKASNDKWGQKRVRFTRFDVIDDFEVAKALFEEVEKWAKAKGMDTICGPLGFSDLEREGLLVEGFDQMSTFEEAYNAPYYQDFIEKLGYEKETEWVESQIRVSKDPEEIENLRKTSEFILKRYKLRFGTAKNIKEFLDKYSEGFFEILDKSYDQLKDIPSYKSWLESNGTLPFPNGESREKFIERTFSAYKKVSSQLEALHINQAAFVVHGGTIMAVLSSILNEPYFNFQIPNCEGYSFEQTFAEYHIKIENLRRL